VEQFLVFRDDTISLFHLKEVQLYEMLVPPVGCIAVNNVLSLLVVQCLPP